MTAVRLFGRKFNPVEGRATGVTTGVTTTGVTRRDLFLGAGGLATSLALGPFVTNVMAEVSPASDVPSEAKTNRKMKVMVAGEHPGDP